MVIFQLTYLPCLLHNSVPFSGVVVCYSQSNEFMVYKVKYSFIVRLRISSRDVQEQWMPVSPHTWDHDIRRYPHFCNSQQYKDSQMSHNSWRELSQTLQKTQELRFFSLLHGRHIQVNLRTYASAVCKCRNHGGAFRAFHGHYFPCICNVFIDKDSTNQP